MTENNTTAPAPLKWFGRTVTWIRDFLTRTGIGTFSRRTVKIGLVATAAVLALTVALSLARRVEPSVNRALGLPDYMADVSARLAHLEAANQELINAVAKCTAPPPRKAAARPPPARKAPEQKPEPREPTFLEKLFGANTEAP